MTLAYVGSLSLADAVPGAAAGAIAGQAGINGALPDIQARITALAAFSPSFGSFVADIALANSVIASINVAITAGLSPPSIGAQLAIVAAMVASLEATAVAIDANLTIVEDLLALLATAGVFAYAYAGTADGLGAALTTELAAGFPGGGPTDATNALVLATTSSPTWTAMTSLFKTAP
jgi:hypothetical protein